MRWRNGPFALRNWNHPPTTLLHADKYQVEIYHTVCVPLVQTSHIYKTLLLLCSSTTMAAGLGSLSTQAVFIRFTSVSACASAQSSQPLVAIRVSWLQFWLSRWVLFWSGSSPHLSGRQGEGMSACVQWSSGKLPSPAPKNESCASFCSPGTGSSPHSSLASESSAAKPGGRSH